ncbi:unnamed protein product [Parnassius mnemosyne]|uniref:C2H2-type domain-containing protein n=2 Tax=Parnassius mnemosyne TaxID=213953 RepID=A0AAV1LA19_9NEOP
MAFSEICRICLSVNVRMFVLKKTGLQNLYNTLMNRFMDENEGPIIVCFTCHARLIRCRRLQQQAIESNAVLEQLLAGGSMLIPKSHEARDEIEFTPICHIDIWPVECDIENDDKDEIFSLDSVKVEEENFENENFKFEENGDHETEPSEKIKSNSTDSNINVVRKENLYYEGPTIKSNSKIKRDNQPINKKEKHSGKIIENKFLKQKCVNILTKKISGASRNSIFECDYCSKKFSTKDVLADHISHSHRTQKNSDAVRTQVEQSPVPQVTDIFSCDICEFKTSQERYILAHRKAHVAKQVYCCNSCDYKCTDKGNFQRHMKKHTGEKPFSCNNCDYKSITKYELQKHMKTHTGEKPFSCNICEYRCIKKSNLKYHIKIHTGEKPFSCNNCDYKCTVKGNFQRHMKKHTGEKPFSCNNCDFKSITKYELQKHMNTHTGEKPFSCNICEYQCVQKNNLQTHMKIHTGEKPFSCNICEYKCIQKSRLQIHMKRHTGEKPYSCHICEYRCILKCNLQKHIKIHTREKPFVCNICEFRCIRKNQL